eukprot:1273266-Prymnesium_polylepis.1
MSRKGGSRRVKKPQQRPVSRASPFARLVFGVRCERREIEAECDRLTRLEAAPPIGCSDALIDGELESVERCGEAASPLRPGAYLWHAPRRPSYRGRCSPRCTRDDRRDWAIAHGFWEHSAHTLGKLCRDNAWTVAR